MSRRPYVRPMPRTWFMESTFYRNYAIRELSCVFDMLYAINLLVGLCALKGGAEGWYSWLAFQKNPLMILFTLVTFGLTIYHAITYFDMTPRVLPQFIRKKVKDPVVNKLMYVGLAGVSAIIIAAAFMGA